ncbi:MAG: hypothetical protein RLZ37_1042 [Actinomycetota bacterium]
MPQAFRRCPVTRSQKCKGPEATRGPCHFCDLGLRRESGGAKRRLPSPAQIRTRGCQTTDTKDANQFDLPKIAI